MRIFRAFSLLFILVLVVFTFATAVSAQTKQIKIENATPGTSWKGADLYRQFCAVCHGINGRGDGPAVEALSSKPSDLTLIRRLNNNKFPTIHIQRVIAGDDRVTAHGSKEMPSWGDTFRSISASETFGEMRVTSLVEYLQMIQR